MNQLPKMIEGSDAQREQKCLNAIQEVLQAFDCLMAPIIVLGPQGVIQATVKIQSLPRETGAELPEEVKKAAMEHQAKMKKVEGQANTEQKDGFKVVDRRSK